MALKTVLAFSVHGYTSLGVLLAFYAVFSLRYHSIQGFLIALWLAVIVDATDGALARRFDVKHVTPNFDGRRLDDIIDYINYAFLPAIAFREFGVLPDHLIWISAFPMLSSAYGFCQVQAKTSDSFVGFPSYWNIVFLYLYFFTPHPFWVAVILIGLSIMVFVPIHYIYPSQTKWMKKPTLALSYVYGLLVGVICLFPKTAWVKGVVVLSLYYPIYYCVVSGLHHRRVLREERRSSPE